MKNWLFWTTYLVLLLLILYFYLKKCLESHHNFRSPFLDIHLPSLTHFGPFLIQKCKNFVLCFLFAVDPKNVLRFLEVST